jgi:ankyrin repeat protein
MSDNKQPHHFEVGQGGSASSPSAEEEAISHSNNGQGLFSDPDQDQQQQQTLSPQQQQALRFLDQQALYLNMTPEEQQQMLIQQQWLLLQQMQMQQGGAAQAAAQQPLNTMNMPQHVMSPLQMSPMFQNQFMGMGMGMMGSQQPYHHQQPSSLFASMASLLPAQAINTTSTYSSNLPTPIAAAAASLQLSNNSQPSIPGMFSSLSFPLNPLAQINIQNNTLPQVDLSDPNQALRANIRQYFLSIGLNVSQAAIEEIVSADESTYGRNSYFDSDDEDEDDDPNSATPSRKLIRLVEDHHWVAAIERISTHPRETSAVGIQGRTPLHVACDHDAPAAIVQALLAAWPEGAERVGTSYMNPLHITCSSAHASIDVVRVLLTGCRDPLRITGAKDVDGDTPLHAACRIGAPMEVLITLLHANPVTVLWNDYEGLNPLMRLWVRYYVLVGETIISNLKRPSDLTPDLVEAWERTVLLLQVMKAMDGTTHQRQLISPFLAVHASSHVNCPRCVVRMAMVLFPEQLLMRDEGGFLPIHIAAAAPVYAVHDLRGEGYSMDDTLIDEETGRPLIRKVKETKYKEPSVIDILLTGEPSAARERDPNGQLPLHVAIMRGKTLEEGVKALADAYPEALTMPDKHTNLFPFMLAASVGRGRGDCSTIYEMVRAAPELVKMALDHSSSSSSSSPSSVPTGGSVSNEGRSSFVDNDELSVDLDQKPRAKESLDQKPSANEEKQE